MVAAIEDRWERRLLVYVVKLDDVEGFEPFYKVGIGGERRLDSHLRRGARLVAVVDVPVALAHDCEHRLLAHPEKFAVPADVWPLKDGRTECLPLEHLPRILQELGRIAYFAAEGVEDPDVFDLAVEERLLMALAA